MVPVDKDSTHTERTTIQTEKDGHIILTLALYRHIVEMDLFYSFVRNYLKHKHIYK